MSYFETEHELIYSRLRSFGDYYPLTVRFDPGQLHTELEALKSQWVPYNRNKNCGFREGLSLYSLNGEVTGEIDLNSVLEFNRLNNTSYNEMSFKTPTPHWTHLKSISSPLEKIKSELGRTHLLKFNPGGNFPPHRDRGNSFRLIAFFDCDHEGLVFLQGDRKVFFQVDRLYFIDTRQTHSLFCFQKEALALVLNVALSREALAFVERNLVAP